MLSEDEMTEKVLRFYEESRLLGKSDYKFRHLSDSKNANRILAYLQAVNLGMKSMHPQELRSVEEALFAKYVHGSNAIEGNTLTLSEVRDVLFKPKNVINRSFHELLQTRNHFKVKELISTWKGELNQALIKEIHKRMMDDVDGYGLLDPAGEYRKNMVTVGGSFASASKPEDIEPDLLRVLNEYHACIKDGYHPFECAVVFHYDFERIHPFRDGNGRTGRAIMDFQLLKAGLPSIYIPPSAKEEYLGALEESGFGSYESLGKFLLDRASATIGFFTVKTSIYDAINTEEMKAKLEGVFGKESFADMWRQCEDARNSEEDP